MTTRKLLDPTAFLLLLLPLLFVGGCGDSDQPIRLGAVLPLTGEWSIYGQPIERGVDLALDEIRAGEAFPYGIEFETKDSETRPELAAELLAELYENGALGAVGGVTSDEALEMVEVADRAEKLLISPSASSPELSGASRYFFRVFPSDFKEGTRMGNFAAQKLELKTVVILAADSTFARGITGVFQDEFDRYDQGEVLEKIVYPPSTTEFGEIAEQVMELNPQAVYVADFADRVRRILHELKERGFEGTLLTTAAFASPDVIEAAGEDAEGVILTQTLFDAGSEDPQVRSFVEAYREKYGEDPGLYAAHGYDAMMVLARSIEIGGGRLPSDVWKGIKGLGEYEGVTGPIQFDGRGDVGKFPRVFIIEGGRLQDYDEVIESKRRELLERLERIRREARGSGG